MESVLCTLQRIEPGLQELKLTRKDVAVLYLKLLKVLKNNTRSSDYVVQFVKKPLCDTSIACDCKACTLGLFAPMRMPIDTYKDLQTKLFPRPIPQAIARMNQASCDICL